MLIFPTKSKFRSFSHTLPNNDGPTGYTVVPDRIGHRSTAKDRVCRRLERDTSLFGRCDSDLHGLSYK